MGLVGSPNFLGSWVVLRVCRAAGTRYKHTSAPARAEDPCVPLLPCHPHPFPSFLPFFKKTSLEPAMGDAHLITSRQVTTHATSSMPSLSSKHCQQTSFFRQTPVASPANLVARATSLAQALEPRYIAPAKVCRTPKPPPRPPAPAIHDQPVASVTVHRSPVLSHPSPESPLTPTIDIAQPLLVPPAYKFHDRQPLSQCRVICQIVLRATGWI